VSHRPRGGYPPSVFALLPRLLERAGNAEQGSITAFYTVLVEGDDLNEPISDTVRGILDGHIVLARTLADRGHYPAIDVLASVSRLMPSLVTPDHRALASEVRELLAAYESARDLIDIGAYVHGTNPTVDRALSLMPEIRRFPATETGGARDLCRDRRLVGATAAGRTGRKGNERRLRR
jgi:flagellum-specific ATP synthase